jgi:hypothetical protein
MAIWAYNFVNLCPVSVLDLDHQGPEMYRTNEFRPCGFCVWKQCKTNPG